jgi:hypothetical protein
MDKYLDKNLRTHMSGWAPGNLQHHLIFTHDVSPTEVPYDGPLDEIHARVHAEQPEHPSLVRLRERDAEAAAQGYTEGDVNHHLQPLIGRLRLLERDGKGLAHDDLAYFIDRMHTACNAELAWLQERTGDGVSDDPTPQWQHDNEEAALAACPGTKFPDGTRCGEYGWHASDCPARTEGP